jgi:hypothetical protein
MRMVKKWAPTEQITENVDAEDKETRPAADGSNVE